MLGYLSMLANFGLLNTSLSHLGRRNFSEQACVPFEINATEAQPLGGAIPGRWPWAV